MAMNIKQKKRAPQGLSRQEIARGKQPLGRSATRGLSRPCAHRPARKQRPETNNVTTNSSERKKGEIHVFAVRLHKQEVLVRLFVLRSALDGQRRAQHQIDTVRAANVHARFSEAAKQREKSTRHNTEGKNECAAEERTAAQNRCLQCGPSAG